MRTTEIIDWVRKEFAPLKLATADEALVQIVENAIRYWNTHSAMKTADMVENSGRAITCPPKFKTVLQVYPATQSSSIFQDHPLFSLLGIVLLDNITQDLILLGEAYKTYKIYTGTDFRWTFNRSSDPQVGGTLFVVNLPVITPRLFIMGTRRLIKDVESGEYEDIVDEPILQWILEYTKALTKMAEGNLLRKGDIAGIKNDGQQIYTEGETAKKELEESLAISSRWVAFAKRM